MILKTNGLISFSFSDSQEAKRIRGNENTFLANPDSRKYYVNMLLENSFSEELNLTLSAPFSYVKHLNFVKHIKASLEFKRPVLLRSGKWQYENGKAPPEN